MPINAVGSNSSPPPIRRHEEIPQIQPTSPKDKKLQSVVGESFKDKKPEKSERKIENPKVKTEKKAEALAKRSSGDWVCTDRKKGENGGYVYRLEFKGSSKSLEDITKVFDGILAQNVKDDRGREFLEALGYHLEVHEGKTVLFIPDKDEVEKRLKVLQNTNDTLKEVGIHSETEPRDRAICEAFRDGKVVLSPDHFIHDNLLFLKTIQRLLTEGPKEQSKRIKEFSTEYQLIKDSRKLLEQSQGNPEITAKLELLENIYSFVAQRFLESPSLKFKSVGSTFIDCEKNSEYLSLVQQKGINSKSYELVRELKLGDLLTPSTKEKTNISATSKFVNRSEEEEIKHKSGHLLDCVGRKPQNGGFVYEFVKRNMSMEEERKIIEQLFPALEPNSFIPNYYPSTSGFGHPFFKKYDEILISLGFDQKINEDGSLVFFMPDRQAIINGWEKAREKDPSLPKIEIVNSKGIASDIEFYKVYSDGKLMISDNIEFIHDVHAHILPMLMLKIESASNPEIEKALKRIKTTLDLAYQKIENAKEAYKEAGKLDKKHQKMFEMMEFVLGANVDLISSSNSIKFDTNGIYSLFSGIWTDQNWKNYIDNRFGTERPSNHEIKELWYNILTERPPK